MNPFAPLITQLRYGASPIQEDRIIVACDQVNRWLVHTTDLRAVSDLRPVADSLRLLAIEHGVSRDTQLEIQETTRRIERAIGVGIKMGQARGEIRKPNQDMRLVLPSPVDYAPPEILSRGAYIFAKLTGSEFEAAVAKAKAEGDLSRTHLIRTIQGKPGRKQLKPERTRAAIIARTRRIAELAKQGYTTHQIAKDVGLKYDATRDITEREGIDVPGDRHTSIRVVDPNRVLDEAVSGIDALASSITLLDGRWDAVDRSRTEEWVDSLSHSLRSLQTLKKQLKELPSDNERA